MQSTSHARERILIYGGPGAGKSYSWADISQWERRTDPEHKIFVVNTDLGRVDRMLDQFPDLGENVTWTDAEDFTEMYEAMKKYGEMGGRDDWLVLDMIDLLYDRCQDWFMEEALAPGKSAPEFMMEYRKQSDANPMTETGGWGINWQIVKRWYRQAMGFIHKFPGHAMVLTPADNVRMPDRNGKGGDAKDVISIFGAWGVKPAGEKRIGHSFPTVLLLAMPTKGKWIYNTVRDNNREEVKGKELTSFAQDYLVDVAGWKLQSGEREAQK